MRTRSQNEITRNGRRQAPPCRSLSWKTTCASPTVSYTHLARDDHGGTQRAVARTEGIYLARDLPAAGADRRGRQRRIGQREAGARLLVGHAAHIGACRRQGHPDAAFVHHALVLLLDLHEHAAVFVRVLARGLAVAAQAQLLLVERLVERSLDKRTAGRVEVQACLLYTSSCV